MSLREELGAVLAGGPDPVAAFGSSGCLHTLWSVFMVYLLSVVLPRRFKCLCGTAVSS